MRWRGAMRDQAPPRNARRAAATARSMSSAVPADISARGSPVAGFMVSKRPPPAQSTNRPSMNRRVSMRERAASAVRASRFVRVLRGKGLKAHGAVTSPTMSASTITQPSACTITGFRSISLEPVAERGDQ